MFTLSQAQTAVKDKPAFSVKDKGTYTVIDYNLMAKDTFVGTTEEETNILLNLRGTAFDNATGNIIRLGYHKFFNVGENPELDAQINLDDNHVITQKLDGSMIAPIYTNEGIVLGTRAGVTDVSALADTFLLGNIDYVAFFELCKDQNLTPIMEFCSRKNRVVIDYPVDKLVLTGMRNMHTGFYIQHHVMSDVAKIYNIPVVDRIDSVLQSEFSQFQEKITGLIDEEGVVIRMESGAFIGNMFKMKSSEYVLRHKTIDGLRFEKDCLLLSLNGLIDDIIPIVSKDMADHILTHTNTFSDALRKTELSIRHEFNKVRQIEDRKEFAMIIKDSPYKAYLFKLHTDISVDVFDLLIKQAKKMCGTQTTTKELKEFIGFSLEY